MVADIDVADGVNDAVDVVVEVVSDGVDDAVGAVDDEDVSTDGKSGVSISEIILFITPITTDLIALKPVTKKLCIPWTVFLALFSRFINPLIIPCIIFIKRLYIKINIFWIIAHRAYKIPTIKPTTSWTVTPICINW